jgi:hypothetical protein
MKKIITTTALVAALGLSSAAPAHAFTFSSITQAAAAVADFFSEKQIRPADLSYVGPLPRPRKHVSNDTQSEAWLLANMAYVARWTTQSGLATWTWNTNNPKNKLQQLHKSWSASVKPNPYNTGGPMNHGNPNN